MSSDIKCRSTIPIGSGQWGGISTRSTALLPVFLPGIGPGIRPRVGMRIHAASQILGSIWVILDEEPNELQVKTLVEAAGVAAMSLLRAKLAADSARRLRLGEVITLLSGGTSAKEAAERLGYGRSKANVLAAGFRSGAGASLEAEADVDQLALTLNTYLDQVFPLSVAAAIGGTVYAVIPHTRHQTDDDYVRRIASEFADRSRSEKSVVIGIGATVADVMTLEKSRDEADRALRVLRSTWNSSGRTVARADDVQINSLLLRLSDAWRTRTRPHRVRSRYCVSTTAVTTSTLSTLSAPGSTRSATFRLLRPWFTSTSTRSGTASRSLPGLPASISMIRKLDSA